MHLCFFILFIFCDETSYCIDQYLISGRSSFSVETIANVFGCFFSRFSTFSGNGGVIFFETEAVSMNLYYSMFFNCSVTSKGGAIYFISEKCNVSRVCSNKCSANTYQFAIFGATNSNMIEYVSITSCSTLQDGYESFRVYKGTQSIKSINSSRNKVIWVSSMVFSDGSSSFIFQSTFVNNSSSDCYCIYSSAISGIVRYINLIQNNSPSRYGVITVWSGSAEYMYCIFLNNTNRLFYINSGSISFLNSFLYHLDSFGSASTLNNSVVLTETFSQTFFSSYYCQTIHSICQTKHMDEQIFNIRNLIGFINVFLI